MDEQHRHTLASVTPRPGSILAQDDPAPRAAETSTAGATRRRLLALIASVTERYVISALYFYFALFDWRWVQLDWPGMRLGDPSYVGPFANDATVFAMDLIMGIVLLIGRRATAAPRTMKDILVPLAASYYFLLFSSVHNLPGSFSWLLQNRAPVGWVDTLNYTSLAIGALSTLLAVWGLVSLGRSFGIFVAVRRVVVRGPYRFIRHPMYTGYSIGSLGLLLAQANVALAILVPMQIALFVWRARLEEARLSEISADYRAYQRRTGAFFPRLQHANDFDTSTDAGERRPAASDRFSAAGPRFDRPPSASRKM